MKRSSTCFLLVLYSLYFYCFKSSAQTYSAVEFNGALGIGSLIPHKSNMQHMLDKGSIYFDLSVAKRSSGNKLFHSAYNYPSFGIGLNALTSGNKNHIGGIVGLYGFKLLPVHKGSNPFKAKIGLGVGYVEKTFTIQNNYQAIAIGSHFNADVVLGIEKKIQFKERHSVKIGLSLTHFSNASFTTPNLGLNFVHAHLGYTIGLKLAQQKEYDFLSILHRPFSITIMSGIGFKENEQPTNQKYAIGQFILQLEKQMNIKTSWFGSMDLYLNQSTVPLTGKSLQTGVFLGHYLNLDKLKIGIGMGAYTSGKPDKNNPLYHKLMVSYHITSRVSALFMLKTHWASADYLSINLGYTLYKK